MDVVGKRVAVIGAGASGLAASVLLSARGAQVCLVDEGTPSIDPERRAELDQAGVDLRLATDEMGMKQVDWVVLSPGIGEGSALLRAVRRLQVPILSEIELAFRLSPQPVVAITGTNGKTTTTRMVETMLLQLGRKCAAAGNIGLPYASAIMARPDAEWFVLEVSSFQLEDTNQFRPRVAVLLNLAPDHLDRHGSTRDYYRAKARLFRNQGLGDWSLVQREALHELESLGVTIRGRVLTFSTKDTSADLYYGRGLIVSRIPGWSGVVYDCSEGNLAGQHNAENLMAAILVGYTLELPLSEIRIALSEFRSDAHRFELLRPLSGVQVVNDSKSTNPDSTRAAIEAGADLVEETGRLWLIAGGVNKQLSFSSLEPLVSEYVDGAFLFGRCRDQIGAAWQRAVPCAMSESMQESVERVLTLAQAGDVVLFSPGCASFDQYRNYRHRGESFRSIIRQYRSDRWSPLMPRESSVPDRLLTGGHSERWGERASTNRQHQTH